MLDGGDGGSWVGAMRVLILEPTLEQQESKRVDLSWGRGSRIRQTVDREYYTGQS